MVIHYTIKTKRQTVTCPQKGYYFLIEKKAFGNHLGAVWGVSFAPGLEV